MAYSTKARKRAIYSTIYAKPSLYWDAIATIATNSGDVEYTPCAYCGEPYDAAEHVYPISQMSSVEILTDNERAMLFVVPACTECNNLAGDLIDESFDARRDRVQTLLRLRYQKYLERPHWDEEDIVDFGDALDGRIRRGNYEQDRILARISYQSE